MTSMYRVSIHNVTTHQIAEGRGRSWDSATRNAMRSLGDRGSIFGGEIVGSNCRRIQSTRTDRYGTHGGYVYTVTTLVTPED